MAIDPQKKKLIIGLSVAAVSVIIVGFVAYKVTAKPVVTGNGTGTTPVPVGSNTPPIPIGVTTQPHATSCGKTSFTIGGTTVTGVVCTAPDTTTVKGSGGLRCHSDQNMYGVPALKCVTFS